MGGGSEVGWYLGEGDADYRRRFVIMGAEPAVTSVACWHGVASCVGRATQSSCAREGWRSQDERVIAWRTAAPYLLLLLLHDTEILFFSPCCIIFLRVPAKNRLFFFQHCCMPFNLFAQIAF